jgi:alpha-galactosidase
MLFNVILLLASASGLDNGLGLTPPLAWASWNSMAADVTDAAVRSTVDALVSTGLAAAGYDTVHIDCGWSLPQRSSNGSLQADPSKFPFGIPAVVNYASARGIKVGIYSEHSTEDCCGGPGMLGFEAQDASTFASWGISFLKVDSCAGHDDIPEQQWLNFGAIRDVSQQHWF